MDLLAEHSTSVKRVSRRHRLEAAAARTLMRLTAPLPHGLRSRLGRGIGLLAHALLKRPRQVAQRNIELCFPELTPAAQRALVREHFCQLGETALELGPLWQGSQARFEAMIQRVEGLEHLHAAQAAGKGIIILSAHFGSWESVALYVSRFGAFTILYMPTHNTAFSAIMEAGRSRFGAHLIVKEKGMRPLLSALRRKEIVGLLADQNVDPREGVFAPFFNLPASTSYAVARLSAHTGAMVLNTFCYRLPGGTGFRLVFRPMPDTYPSGNDVEDAAMMNKMLENAIREAPAQYWWVHRRFKDQPEGRQPPY